MKNIWQVGEEWEDGDHEFYAVRREFERVVEVWEDFVRP